jgi:THO complex subunit 2
MHKLKTPNFSTLYCYDRIFCVITSLTMCTENEANRYGRFLCAMLETVMHWHSNKKIFDEECANYPGFVIKSRVGNQPLENHVDFEIYRHVVYKWHHEISKALVVYLESKDYVQIRNALIVGNGTLVGGVGPFNFQD